MPCQLLVNSVWQRTHNSYVREPEQINHRSADRCMREYLVKLPALLIILQTLLSFKQNSVEEQNPVSKNSWQHWLLALRAGPLGF